MKDEINCYHNCGGVAYLLQIVAIHFNLTVTQISSKIKMRIKKKKRKQLKNEEITLVHPVPVKYWFLQETKIPRFI